MISDFPVIIDSNVLMQAAVRDTLLRLSEQRLFTCRWSDDIIAEVRHNLIHKLKLAEPSVDRLLGELRAYFPDAWVDSGYKVLIPAMTNNEKDRHVVAAAVKCQAEVIMTYNLKHYPESSIKPLNIRAKTPDEYLVDLCGVNPEIVVHTLYQQGAQLNPPHSIEQVLNALEVCGCAMFARLIRDRLSL
jgi:predicted nucleic acid-binding protein